MAKKPRITKAQKFQNAVDSAVAASLAKQPSPAPTPAPSPPDDAAVAREKHQRKIAAVHEAARIARRAGVPDDVVDELKQKASELEKA